MRPVNLLPASARPYQSSGAKSTATYVVLGVLGLLVVAAVVYVTTANQITARKNQIAEAQAAQAQAQAKAANLQTYGSYAQIADTRIFTVASLAIGRIDYERLMRETARVLPAGVWLSSLDAEAGTGAAATTSSTPTAGGPSSGGPTVHLLGCAKTQDDVATTMVRLRAIHGSDEVDLNSSTKALTSGSSVSDSAASTAGCGNNYSFDILVDLATAKVNGAGDAGQKVPVALGGGS
jgi:Tfp pilus assembly protein PilN